jgi:tRNA dimethylallyltransferase
LRDTGIFATRQLAKRQLTWLRSMPERRVVACEQVNTAATVIELMHNRLHHAHV